MLPQFLKWSEHSVFVGAKTIWCILRANLCFSRTVLESGTNLPYGLALRKSCMNGTGAASFSKSVRLSQSRTPLCKLGSMCDLSYPWIQERWNVYCTEVTFTEEVSDGSSEARAIWAARYSVGVSLHTFLNTRQKYAASL